MRVIETLSQPDKIDLWGDNLGFIRLVGYFGDDLSVVNAARVSFHKESEWEVHDHHRPEDNHLRDADQGLINFLMRNKHGTPFEQGFMAQFHCRVPIFVMREWVRHRIGISINEESGRYVEMRPDFYSPPVDHVRSQVGKSGAYSFEAVDQGTAEWWRGELEFASQRNFDLYRRALEVGIAKEVARTCLTLNLYTEFRWCCNARSLMHFLELRNAPQAMQEIRECADAMERLFAREMPALYSAFVDADRVAP